MSCRLQFIDSARFTASSVINLVECHDLYVQRFDVLENFQKMCLEIYELDLAYFLSALGLAWQVTLEKTKVKLDLLTDIDMLLMVEKVSEEEYATLFINMQNLITSTSKIMIKIKNRHIFNVGM